mgnify:CR=1 FL=1
MEFFISQAANSKFLLVSKYFTKNTDIEKINIIVTGKTILFKFFILYLFKIFLFLKNLFYSH